MALTLSSVAWFKAHRRLEQVLREAEIRENPLETWATSCQICLALLRIINTSTASRAETSLGILKHLVESNCPNHAALFPPNQALLSQQILLRRPARQRLLYLHPDPYSIDTSAALNAPWEVFEPRRGSRLFSATTDLSQPRIVDQNWIDLGLLKQWYRECESHHDADCGSRQPNSTLSSYPSLLVDTTQRCLVPGTTSSRYVALSYVWGLCNSFLTTRVTLELLCKPGALAQTSGAAVQLSRTIHEAIALTKALEERFLWVDALCIVHDSEDKMDQLNAMASLYANASLTIVAAQGEDANFGFRGLRDISQPRYTTQRIATLLPDQQLVKPGSRHVWDDSLLEPWSTRAWTFQEAICSRRLLYFSHESVRWCCKKTRWSEESDSPDCVLMYATAEQRQFSLASPQLSTSFLPALNEYEALVNGFNSRKLTYPGDALAAFAGVASRLGKKFSGGLISGLPEVFFDICLLWRPLRRLGPAHRRHNETTMLINSCLPSWSWAGWETEVSWPYTWNRNNDPAGPVPIVLGKLRPFYRIQQIRYSDQQGSRILVDNSWLHFAISALDEQTPDGWSSRRFKDSELRDYGQIDGAAFFTHDLDRSVEFCFPVPLSNELMPPRAAQFLHFRTTSGRFRLGETRRAMTRIYTLSGAAAGTLYQHDESDADYIRATSPEQPLNERCEIDLIAIMGCIVPKNDGVIWDPSDLLSIQNVEDSDVETEPPRTAEVYNVLWIEWSGRVAYRKATGEIDRLVWEANAKDWIDVTLG